MCYIYYLHNTYHFTCHNGLPSLRFREPFDFQIQTSTDPKVPGSKLKLKLKSKSEPEPELELQA